SLKDDLYAEHPDRVMSITDFVDFDNAEIEDLFPPEYLAAELDRMEREPEERLADIVCQNEPFVGQVERWAKQQGLTLDPHWKLHLAIRVKKRALSRGIKDFPDENIEKWVYLFENFY